MDYNIKEKDAVVRLREEEREVFKYNISFEKFIVEEISDEIIYIYKSDDLALTESDIEVIETELMRIEEIIEDNCYGSN